MNSELKRDIQKLKEELEDRTLSAEERASIRTYMNRLKALLKEKESEKQEATFMECGLCQGTGTQSEYDEIWDCPNCDGRGGSWS